MCIYVYLKVYKNKTEVRNKQNYRDSMVKINYLKKQRRPVTVRNKLSEETKKNFYDLSL